MICSQLSHLPTIHRGLLLLISYMCATLEPVIQKGWLDFQSRESRSRHKWKKFEVGAWAGGGLVGA